MHMDTKDLVQKSVTELEQLMGEAREQLRRFRFEASERQLKNVRMIRSVRRTIARIQTILVTKQTS